MTDVRIVGVALLAIVPLMVLEATAYVPAGFNTPFWNLSLADKLPRIAAEKRRWLLAARVWMALPVVVGAGLLAAAVVALGVDPWVWLGTGVAIICAGMAVVLFAIQGPAAVAVAVRGEGVPGWLEAFWQVLYDLERAYVLGTSLGCVMIGIGLVHGPVLGAWVPWAMIIGPGLVVITASTTRFFFPHMALLGPLILAVGMVLS